jgi:glucans biosynthesis protein
LPASLKSFDWDDYQQLHFNKEGALLRDQKSDFRAELFHLGIGFDKPIHMNTLEDGKSTLIPYSSSSSFDYGKSKVDGDQLPKDLGFAGFRIQFATDWQRDIVAFLGASYFRAVGSEMQYGLSARGLAVDTALPKSEKFPTFTHFWLEKPTLGSDVVTVYALMDSPSVSGAYRFDMQPSEPFKMKVDSAIYPRKAIERLGVAPMTSMYMIGENDRRTNYDWRAEIHDSNGLAMQTGNGEWIWRRWAIRKTLGLMLIVMRTQKGLVCYSVTDILIITKTMVFSMRNDLVCILNRLEVGGKVLFNLSKFRR